MHRCGIEHKEIEMDAQQNKQLAMQAYQMFNDKNIKGLLDMYQDDVEWIGADNEHIPMAGNYHGKAGVAQFFAKLDEMLEAISFEPKKFIAEGDTVVAIGDSRWRVKSTGQSYDNPWVHVMTIRDGKVARFQQYNDTAAAEAAFRPISGIGQSADAPLHH
jgi:ketosteroid isomerase-like protein